jgi:DNA repair exonuclease SbcCD ATPase subunit
VREAATLEVKLTGLNEELRQKKLEHLSELNGTAMEKTIQLEAKLAPLLKDIEKTEAQMKYWRAISKAIENKISLAQSILANITSQVRAGLYLNNIK